MRGLAEPEPARQRHPYLELVRACPGAQHRSATRATASTSRSSIAARCTTTDRGRPLRLALHVLGRQPFRGQRLPRQRGRCGAHELQGHRPAPQPLSLQPGPPFVRNPVADGRTHHTGGQRDRRQYRRGVLRKRSRQSSAGQHDCSQPHRHPRLGQFRRQRVRGQPLHRQPAHGGNHRWQPDQPLGHRWPRQLLGRCRDTRSRSRRHCGRAASRTRSLREAPARLPGHRIACRQPWRTTPALRPRAHRIARPARRLDPAPLVQPTRP